MPFVPLIVVLHGFGIINIDRRYDESEIRYYKKSIASLNTDFQTQLLKPSPHWRTFTYMEEPLSLEEFRKILLKQIFFTMDQILDTGYLFSKK